MEELNLEGLIAMVETGTPDADPLQRLTEAVILGARLQETSDDLVDHFVTGARAAGASWADIGEAMGVTRQAAQKRFVGRTRGRGKGWSLFTRFGEQPRAIVRRAVAIAHSRGDDHVGTEHLVLGLLDDDGGLIATMVDADTLEVIRTAAAGPDRPHDRPTRGHIPFAADAKKTLELSLRETIRANQKTIEEQHIILALLRTDSPGQRALAAGGITYQGFATWSEQNLP